MIKEGMSVITVAVHDICDEYGKKGPKSNLVQIKRNGRRTATPGLMYAVHIALLAGSQEELQALVIICGVEGNIPGFTFSANKSGFMIFNDSTDQMHTI